MSARRATPETIEDRASLFAGAGDAGWNGKKYADHSRDRGRLDSCFAPGGVGDAIAQDQRRSDKGGTMTVPAPATLERLQAVCERRH